MRILRSRHEIGRSLTEDEQTHLLAACKKSRSRSLYPAVLLSLHTGLRNAELRLLRWRQVDLLDRTITVGKSKTTGGEGRIVPLSQTATECLQAWRSEFPNAQPAHYLFPSERHGLDGEKGYQDGKIVPMTFDLISRSDRGKSAGPRLAKLRKFPAACTICGIRL